MRNFITLLFTILFYTFNTKLDYRSIYKIKDFSRIVLKKGDIVHCCKKPEKRYYILLFQLLFLSQLPRPVTFIGASQRLFY